MFMYVLGDKVCDLLGIVNTVVKKRNKKRK
jgi:hypothetical protein